MVIRLKGLEKNVRYTLAFQDRTNQGRVMTGRRLMENAIRVSGMTGAFVSEIIWINR